MCLHGLESRSERRFGTWFKRDWDRDLNYVRYMGYKRLSNHDQDCALRVIFCSYYAVRARWLTHALMYGFSAHFKMHTHESRSETALRLHGLESAFLCGSRFKTPFFSRFKTRFKSLIWNSFLFTWAKIRLSNQEKAESRFETSFGTWF